jgi:crossover junction endodeoxyribonuclease RusA
MDEINLVIPPVPSVNHLYFNCHGRRAMTTQGKAFKAEVGAIAMAEKVRQKWKCPVASKIVMELFIYWPDKRKRDADNIIKIIQDSFTGILWDDDRWVLPRIMNWELYTADPRVSVRIFKL